MIRRLEPLEIRGVLLVHALNGVAIIASMYKIICNHFILKDEITNLK